MGVNHMIVGGQVKLDLTTDTITADKLVAGYTAHDKAGDSITGSMQVQTYYTGTNAPSQSLGVNGDIYLRR